MEANMRSTLCWDCSKATGGCRWADEFKPVRNWDARKIERKDHSDRPMYTYLVLDCPEFDRDACGFGQKRLREKTIFNL